MRTSLHRDLTTALKARDRVAVAALRSALAAIENAEAVAADPAAGTGGRAVAGNAHVAGAADGPGAGDVERRLLTGADLHAIVQGEVRERSAAAQQYDRIGRHDLAGRLRSEAEVLSRYLHPAG